jgi:hypothetical protein
MGQVDFSPLSFRQVRHNELRPAIFDGDHTRGEDYCSGTLRSLRHAPNAVLFTVAFVPGPDAKPGDAAPRGEVEFFVMRYRKRLIGRIAQQAPERFCWMSGAEEELKQLDGLGTGPGLGYRAAANFFCSLPGYPGQFCVSAYFRNGLFGNWKEIVIQTPKKTLYAAYP